MTVSAKADTAKNNYRLILILCWAFYLFSIAAKNAYMAQIVQIIEDFGTTKASAGLASTFYFITYGTMQLVLAKILPRLNLRYFVLITMGLSSLVNVCIVFCTQVWQIWIVFAITGLLQAGLWPSCIATVSQYLPTSMYGGAVTLLSTGFAAGMGIAYCFSALLLAVSNWRTTFWVLNGAMLVSVLLFFFVLSKAKKVEEEGPHPVIRKDVKPGIKESSPYSKGYVTAFLCLVAVGTLFSNIAFYGIYNWVPNLLFEEFGLPSSLSTLLTVSLPICAIGGPPLATWLCQKHDFWRVSLGLMIAAGLAALLMVFVFRSNLWLSLLLSLVFIVLVRGVTNMEAAVLPLKSRDMLNAGSLAAITNATASIGAALAPLIMGGIMDASTEHGRRASYVFIVIACVIVGVFSQLTYNFVRKRNGK